MTNPIAFVTTITVEIFIANTSQLATCTIGRIDSTMNPSVMMNPDAAAAFSHRGDGTPAIGIANMTR